MNIHLINKLLNIQMWNFWINLIYNVYVSENIILIHLSIKFFFIELRVKYLKIYNEKKNFVLAILRRKK